MVYRIRLLRPVGKEMASRKKTVAQDQVPERKQEA
jgi:hypothetical protein